MKVGFISLGCAKNLVDSEYIIGMFNDKKFEISNKPSECDVIVINTCGFILSAKQEAINTILEMAELKQNNLKKLIVTGCLSQRYREDLALEIPEVDAFIKIDEYDKLDEILSEVLETEIAAKYMENRKLITNNYYAYLKISEGCDNRCTYCAIPLIRGNCHSYPIEDCVKEAKRLYDLGVRELNVVAQDTTYYGHDIYGKFMLKELLTKLNEIPFKWIRVIYIYQDEIEDELLVTMSKLERVLPYFDIPIQYGNDKILKLMNRRGSVELIKQKVNRIRELFENAVIRTTLIVGFPYETDDTFNDTLELVKELEFDSLGAFTYSKEEDTKAYDFEEEVPEELANERYATLMEMQNQIISTKNQKRLNQVVEVLIERYEDLFDRYVGRAYFSAPDGIDGVVYIKTDNALKIGEFYKVKLEKVEAYDFHGKIVL